MNNPFGRRPEPPKSSNSGISKYVSIIYDDPQIWGLVKTSCAFVVGVALARAISQEITSLNVE